MNKQILIIRGGDTYLNHDAFINELKNKEVALDRLKPRPGWKENLAGDLGEGYDVFVPKMPNSNNAKYEEWKIWFERIMPLLGDGLILVGSSLGGTFLAKYLSQNQVIKKIDAVILIAASFMDTDFDKIADFSLPESMAKFNQQVEKIILMQSEDDSVVPCSHVYMYKNAIPNAEVMIFKDRGHFNQPHFQELVDLIKLL